jgi:hypothetical protein
MLGTHTVSVSFKANAPTAEGPAPRVERRLGTGMGFAACSLLDSVLQVFAHARARTCPPVAGRAVVLAMLRQSAGRASEIVMQPTSGASVRREPARPRRLVLMRLHESEEPEK